MSKPFNPPPTTAQQQTICPRCGAANQCAIAAGNPASECWCMALPVTAAAPLYADTQQCLCQQCLSEPGELQCDEI